MNFLQLQLVLVLLGLSASVTSRIMRSFSNSDTFTFILGLVLFSLVFLIGCAIAWPIWQRLGFGPLFVRSGPCPYCQERPAKWLIRAQSKDRAALSCGQCGGQLELWLMRRPPMEHVSKVVPSFALRWPQFLGLWRRISVADVPPPLGAE